jgi:hypothetical protein
MNRERKKAAITYENWPARWASVPDAVRLSGVKRGTLYHLVAEGSVESRLIRRRDATGPGSRLVDLKSLFAFIENSPTKAPDTVRRKLRQTARDGGGKLGPHAAARAARIANAAKAANARWAKYRAAKEAAA